ncbi:uncharacterized protein LOC142644147 [Castanea sativa]|uniref:uncharacterized protein LOC142644147 n=1 Tax=Castanea sativa TaxID=21020 RepID=UPI003F65465D
MTIDRRGWRATLVGSNEAIKLELPRAWEPLDRLKPLQAGLAFLWKNDVSLEVINFTANHVLAKVTEGDGYVWYLTGFYGWPDAQQKENSWRLLKYLQTFVVGPWVVIGDFNAYLHASEKESARQSQFSQIEAFREALSSGQLNDLGFKGYPYTWSNKRPGEANTKIRLDRDIIQEAWGKAGVDRDGLGAVQEKIKACGVDLMAWGSPITNPDTIALKETQMQLDRLNEAELTEASKAEFLSLSKRMDELLQKQEIYWAQRSRINWMKHGDRNTKFFHAKASQRQRKNYINGIRNSQGIWVENLEEVVEVESDYFDNLFQEGVGDQMEACLDAVESRVIDDMQEFLSTQFTAEEVQVALFQMGPTKAPGPDAVLDFLNNGNMLPDINHTNIVLIPKVQNLERMSEFRPISLCNVIYKIISKVLANRLKQKGYISEILRVKEVDRFVNYLGLPTLIGRAKYNTFSYLKGRIWKKLQGWKGMLLSRAGKEILIKAVAQSIPKYTMSVFQIPLKLCNELDALCAKFWWGQIGNERKIHWKSWDKLSASKKEGGMGFRDLRAFNLAMLAKQGWRMVQGNDSLLYQCFKARYFPRSSFLEAKESPNCSYVWRSLMAAKPIIQSGHCWRVGNGHSINALTDRWLPNFPTHGVLNSVQENWDELMVADLINPELNIWKYENIMAIFHRDEAEAICQIPLSKRNVPDSVFWLHNSRGLFTVKSAYHVARRLLTDAYWGGSSRECAAANVWTAIWKLRLPNKIKVFAWRACHEILPTAANLTRRKVITEDKCSVCTWETESTIHALWDCVAVQDIWAGSS